MSASDKGLTVAFHADAEKAKPGLKGNLIANASEKHRVTGKDGKIRDTRTFMGALPTIQFEVVKP